MVSKRNSPLAPSLGLTLLVFSTLILVLVVLNLVVALVVLPPPLVQVVSPTTPCKLLKEIFISSSSLYLQLINHDHFHQVTFMAKSGNNG